MGASTEPNAGTILAVDDEELNRILLGTLLDRGGYTARLAANGEEALAALRAGDIELVLLDVEMPGMGGLELARRIREQQGRPYLPIIAVTANTSPERVLQLQDAGVTSYLSKPFRREKLLSLIRSVLDGASDTCIPAPLEDGDCANLLQLIGPASFDSGMARLRDQIDGLLRLSSADLVRVAERAHALVSQSALFGLSELARKCQDLEQACKRDHDVAASLAAVQVEARLSLERLPDLVKARSPET